MNSVPMQIRAQAALELRRRQAVSARVPLERPPLYPLQAEIKAHPAKRKVVATGRRVGKTWLAGDIALDCIGNGQKALYISTSQDQTDLFWERVKKWLIGRPGLYKNETRRLLRLGTGQIRAKTGSNPDILRGEDCDLLILDECAFLDPAAWYEVGAPMLIDRDGIVYFFSTPNRKNWFYFLYNKALADSSGRWAAWNVPTQANPHLSIEALAELTTDMTAEAYRQEILAEFLESGGEVFRKIQTCVTEERPQPYDGEFVFGVDWAQKNDYTVICVMDRQKRCMVDLDRFNQVDWHLQRGRLRSLYERWQPVAIWAESNSIGGPNIEALQREGLPIYAFETTALSKPPLIESLVLAFERNEIVILDDGVLIGELAAYERKVSAATGRSSYAAPEGLHDDCVMALALAWRACQQGGVPMILDW